MREVARQCWEAFSEAVPAGTVHVVAFWCNAGEHRSVCAAALFADWLAQQGLERSVVHLCAPLWDHRSCGGCAECNPYRTDGRRDEAYANFARAMRGYADEQGRGPR